MNMQQQVQAMQEQPESKPQWEAPELQSADVTSTTLAGGANNVDGGAFSS